MVQLNPVCSRSAFLAAVVLLLVAGAAPVASGAASAGVAGTTTSVEIVGGPRTGGIERVVEVLPRDIGLPLPAGTRVHVYTTREAFRRGLVKDAAMGEEGADELAAFAIGIARPGRVLLNGRLAGGGREWLRLIAHELAHVSQIEMAGGEGRAEQWLAEGMAEWVAFTSLEHLGLDTLANRRALATAGIRNHAALVAARLDLETLGNPRGFTVRHLKEGSLPTYQLAFLMADYLVERDGFERVVAYFKSFERRQDRHSNFRDTFGQSLDQFEKEVLAHLKTVVR